MGRVVGAAGRTAGAAAQALGVELQFGDGAAESIAMHSKLACGLALVSLVLLQHGRV